MYLTHRFHYSVTTLVRDILLKRCYSDKTYKKRAHSLSEQRERALSMYLHIRQYSDNSPGDRVYEKESSLKHETFKRRHELYLVITDSIIHRRVNNLMSNGIWNLLFYC